MAFSFAKRDRLRSEAFTLQTLALHLAGTTHGLGNLTGTTLGGLFKVATELHLTEDAFALHFLLEGFQRLVNIIITNENLHGVVISFGVLILPSGVCSITH